MNVEAVQKVYPTLPRETAQELDTTFRECQAY